MKNTFIMSALVAYASAHGLIRSIQGANGVEMPGLSVQDGVPRNCNTNRCGAEADTSIIRNREISSGKASPLGRTQGGGPVDAAKAIAAFMGSGASGNSSQGAADTKRDSDSRRRRQFGRRAKLSGQTANNGANGQVGDVENIVAQTAGKGASAGLPTSADDGTIKMNFFQVNADGAGPLSAAIDPTSGGTDPNAFQQATVTQNIPGVLSLSGNKKTEMPIQVQMPQGMTCDGSVGGVQNVCIVRVQNKAVAGPFGGSAAFTQSNAARKRAIEYRLKKRAAQRFDA